MEVSEDEETYVHNCNFKIIDYHHFVFIKTNTKYFDSINKFLISRIKLEILNKEKLE